MGSNIIKYSQIVIENVIYDRQVKLGNEGLILNAIKNGSFQIVEVIPDEDLFLTGDGGIYVKFEIDSLIMRYCISTNEYSEYYRIYRDDLLNEILK